MTNGINFGSLTVNGQTLKFQDFDKNGDGKISQEEYTVTLREYGLDEVELSTVDKNDDKKVSKEEFAVWEQEILMKEAVDKLIKDVISKELIGALSQYQKPVVDALNDYIQEFVNSYGTDNIDKMAAKFEKALPAKYEEIKEEIVSGGKGRGNGLSNEDYIDAAEYVVEKWYMNVPNQQKLFTNLIDIARIIVASNSKLTKDQLINKLHKYIESNISSLLQYNIEDYSRIAGSFGNYVSTNEFTKLKSAAEEFFKAALSKGIVITVNGDKIDSEDAIAALLNKFKPTTAWALQNLMKKISESLPTESNLELFKEGKSGINIQMDMIDNLSKDEPDGLDLSGLTTEQLEAIEKEVEYFYTWIKNACKDAEGWKMLYWIGRKLEQKAVEFVKNHPDALNPNSGYTTLHWYLRNYMFQNDAEKMSETSSAWDATVADLGVIKPEELDTLKQAAITFIEETFKNGIQICGKDGNRLSLAQLKAIINNIDIFHVDNLKNLINNIKDSLSTTEKYRQLLYSPKGCDKIIIDTETFEAILSPTVNEDGEMTLSIDTEKLFENNESCWWKRSTLRGLMIDNLQDELRKVWDALCSAYGIDKLTDEKFDSLFMLALSTVEGNKSNFTFGCYRGKPSDYADLVVKEFNVIIEKILNPDEEEEVTFPGANHYSSAQIKTVMDDVLKPQLKARLQTLCDEYGVDPDYIDFDLLYTQAYNNIERRYDFKNGTTYIDPEVFAMEISMEFEKLLVQKPNKDDLELDDIKVEGDKKRYTRAEIRKYMKDNLMPQLEAKARNMCAKYKIEFDMKKFEDIYEKAFLETANMNRYFRGTDSSFASKITPNKFAKFMKNTFGDEFTQWVKEQKQG